MNKILVQLETGDEQEIEFEQPVSNVKLVNTSWKRRFLAKRGAIGFFVGMLVMAFYYRNNSYYDLHKDHKMEWHAEKCTCVKSSPSP